MRTVRLRNPSEMRIDSRLVNILQLGFAFFVIFTAFQTCGQIQTTVLSSVAKQSSEVTKQSGYYSSAIIYGAFTVFNFFAAALVGLISAKWSMVIGGSFYTLFLASFLYIRSAFLYSTSALLGIGAAMIWVGQGQYLTKNSDDETMGRNSAIAWAMLQCSLPVGGIIVFTQFRDVDDLSDHTIKVVYICFTCLAGAGVLILAFLRRPPVTTALVSPTAASNSAVSIDDTTVVSTDSTGRPVANQQRIFIDLPDDPRNVQVQGVAIAGTPATNSNEEEVGGLMKSDVRTDDHPEGILQSFASTFKLLKTIPMLLLAVVFIYTGLELTFWSGVYGTSLGNTKKFGSVAKELLAINIIFLGLGEIIGGGLFGILGKKIHTRVGRSPIVLLGLIVHIVSFILIFINIPRLAPIDSTDDSAYIEPNAYLAIFCSLLLGFADSCWNTQVYSLLGTFYSDNSAAAFALFKFFQSGAACGGFFYTPHLTLEWQLVILAITCILGGLAFFTVNYLVQKAASRNEKAA